MARKARPAKPKKTAGAESAAGAKTRARAARAKAPADARAAVVKAVLDMAAGGRWPGAAVADIAAEAGLSPAQTMAHLPCPQAALRLIAAEADRRVLNSADAEPADAAAPAKDRLFDVMMRRFDALQDMRGGVLALTDAALRDPAAAALTASRAPRSMALMLETAGISSAGPLGALRVKGLIVAYARAFCAWRKDDSPDMAAAMAALDAALSRGEAVMQKICAPLRRRADAEPPGDG